MSFLELRDVTKASGEGASEVVALSPVPTPEAILATSPHSSGQPAEALCAPGRRRPGGGPSKPAHCRDDGASVGIERLVGRVVHEVDGELIDSEP